MTKKSTHPLLGRAVVVCYDARPLVRYTEHPAVIERVMPSSLVRVRLTCSHAPLYSDVSFNPMGGEARGWPTLHLAFKPRPSPVAFCGEF